MTAWAGRLPARRGDGVPPQGWPEGAYALRHSAGGVPCCVPFCVPFCVPCGGIGLRGKAAWRRRVTTLALGWALAALSMFSIFSAMPAWAARAAQATQAADADGGPVRATVYAAGDIADCRYSRPAYSGAAATAALIMAGPPDAAILSLGDHAYPASTAQALRGCYDATWGVFRDRTHPVPGNHDYAGGKSDAYYQYFGALAGPSRRGYYSFELGGWRLYALNSHLKGPDQAAQLQWLKDDLASHPARCTLAYWHVPLFSSGGHISDGHMREAWRLLHAAGAELVLSGHDHDYERFEPLDADGNIDRQRGLRQFVIGTGGAYLTPFLWPEHGSVVRQNNTHGVLKLQLQDDGYRWEFLPADSHSPAPDFPSPQQRDSGSARCH